MGPFYLTTPWATQRAPRPHEGSPRPHQGPLGEAPPATLNQRCGSPHIGCYTHTRVCPKTTSPDLSYVSDPAATKAQDKTERPTNLAQSPEHPQPCCFLKRTMHTSATIDVRDSA
eukprot:3541341-Amphidinium_carterae.1